MIEKGGLPIFSYKYKSQTETSNKQKKVKSDKSKQSSKKTRFISTDMTKVNIADVLSFIKQDTTPDNILAEFENLDIVEQL
jgi:hypothetical protein